MDLTKVFGDFKKGNRKSKLWQVEEKKRKQELREKKQKENLEKDKQQKDEHKRECDHCEGSGIEPDTDGYRCHKCYGRGYIKLRKPISKPKKRSQDKIVGKKLKKRIINFYLVDNMTPEEIGGKVNLETWIFENVIEDTKKTLEEALNRNN